MRLLFLQLAASLAFTLIFEYFLVTAETPELVFVCAFLFYIGFVGFFYEMHRQKAGVDWALKKLLLDNNVEKNAKLRTRNVGLIFVACVSGLALGVAIHILGIDMHLLAKGIALAVFPCLWLVDTAIITHSYVHRRA